MSAFWQALQIFDSVVGSVVIDVVDVVLFGDGPVDSNPYFAVKSQRALGLLRFVGSLVVAARAGAVAVPLFSVP